MYEIICIKNCNRSVSFKDGQIYIITNLDIDHIEINKKWFSIKNMGSYYDIYEEYFITLAEYREQRINKILYDD